MARIRKFNKLNIRLPDELRSWLDQQADFNFTSVNAEIIAAIRMAMHLQPPRADT